jgi:C-3',4' desaturase CrtD
MEPDVCVIGAGIAGLSAAALLVASGRRVQVLEGHTTPGGCAGFFQREGYRFDAGATLVGGFGRDGVHRRLIERLGITLAVHPVEPAMIVHLPGASIRRWGDPARWQAERLRVFGAVCEPFWREQEQLAASAWAFSTRFPALPRDAAGLRAFIGALRPGQLRAAAALGRTVADAIPVDAPPLLRLFLDAQLLITAQTDAAGCDLAYGMAALDLAHSGTFHVPGGVGAIATALARSVRAGGGEIAYGTSAVEIVCERGAVRGVRCADGTVVRAAHVIAAIPAWDTLRLLGEERAPALARRTAALPQRWSAYMTYLGVPPGIIADDVDGHHQLVEQADAPLGEGNSVFLSFSAPGEPGRARDGGRTVTISTHTDVALWDRAAEADGLRSLEDGLAERLRVACERIAPGAWDAARLRLPGTPHTFARYTGRHRGLVGGVAQTPAASGLRALGHPSGMRGLLLCGDTTFPGQSTVGATLSGVAAARALGARL